jgi:hypothetical protein
MDIIGIIKCKLGFHDWKLVATRFDNIVIRIYECNRPGCGKTEEE